MKDNRILAITLALSSILEIGRAFSGTDSDWVVKVIDVYPDEVAGQPEMGGYQLMVSADIFRGRYRESLDPPSLAAPGQTPEVFDDCWEPGC